MEFDKTDAAVQGGDFIFALDIGTRSVIGVVGKQDGEVFRVLDVETKEHPKRAMIDGQIEDIGQVAKVAGLVKERLEQRAGFPLTRVCVAAAGRALKTSRAVYETTLSEAELISEQTVYAMEMNAVNEARELVNAENGELQFYCVGYAVIRYYLDDYPFATILNHKGHAARVEIIATFLPNEVVDSLCAAMSMIHLEIEHLTLEPIAAMNAVIPADLRLLNLALVDIGAGTSDIAISDGGSVSAYTMATVAGDELTEEIIQHCLVDFHTAEGMKHAAARGDAEIPYRDILGFDYTMSLEELLSLLRPAVENLSAIICEKILDANGKAPSAVFLVGGGSKAPLLCELVADGLKIDRRKVAVGGNNFIQRVARSELELSGPEYATPVGIAITGAAAGAQERFFVYINGEKTRVFRNHAVAVMDVLLMSGYQYNQLMGKTGKSIFYTLNGEKKVVRGGMYAPAEIRVNDVPAGISTPVACGDEITICPAGQGEDAQMPVEELAVSRRELIVSFDGVLLDAGCRIQVNGKPVEPGQLLCDNDQVECLSIFTLEELCAQCGVLMAENTLLVNGEAQDGDYLLEDGDEVCCVVQALERHPSPSMPIPEPELEFEPEPEPEPEPQPKPEPKPEPAPARHSFYEESFASVSAVEAGLTGRKAIRVTVNGQSALLPPRESGMPYQFLDMLNLVEIDTSKPQGNIILQLNGHDATYLEQVNDGDRVEIYWDAG